MVVYVEQDGQILAEQEARLDQMLRALADTTRRDIVQRSIDGEHTVSALAAHYDMSFAAVQKHVSVLQAAELIIKRAEGRERFVRANPESLARVRALLERYHSLWRERADRLDHFLAEEPHAGFRPEQ